MRQNVRPKATEFTHEGAPAKMVGAEAALRRSVLSCLLWEREFYEDGVEIAERIGDLAARVPVSVLADLAIEARGPFNLRHVPLLLLVHLAKHGAGSALVSQTVCEVIQRADEMGELLALYWMINERAPQGPRRIPAQIKKGLALAFRKFDAYQLAKYDRDVAVKLRDVMFLVHPKPVDEAQEALWRRLVAGELEAPDTWEVALSAGADKRATFERLLETESLGYLALLRNLRNMVEAGVDGLLLREAILARRGARRVLPFRYVAAARACPQLEPVIDQALSEAISESEPLPGRTIVLVDVSRSMEDNLSRRSDLSRMDAAAALASIIHGDLRMFTFSSRGLAWDGFGTRHVWDGTPVAVEVPPRRGMAGVDAVVNSQEHGGTMLGQAVTEINGIEHDRLIVITDEQSHDSVPDPVAPLAYMINVASARNGVGYHRWTHIDGFSEAVLRFIHEAERAPRTLR